MSFTGPLSIITLVPLLSGLILLVLPNVLPNDVSLRMKASVRNVAIGLSSAIFLLTTLIFVGTIGQIDWLSIGMGDYVLETEDPVWLIESIGVTWHLGTDALSFPMIWLTTLLIPISMLVQWDAEDGHSFHSLLLIMEGALIGVFVSLDLFVFYIFWELTLVPMFFLIMIWGGEDRKYASMKFFIYTFTASVLMLVGILVMYFNTVADPNYAGTLTGHHFNLVLMTEQSRVDGLITSEGLRHFVWLLLLIGFATKMPSVPVHTWLPDAHVQAPTAGSMLLAGVMLKMGAYGFLRIAVAMFPESTLTFVPLLVFLGMASLVYGAVVCLGQTNLKRMVAYSSVSHMGLIFLGIATMQPLGFAGALFMMFAHGIISPLLFAVAGSFKHHYHTLEIGSMRGIAHHSPFLAGHMMLGWMGSLGLPLLAGFVAEVAIMIAFWMTFGWWVLLPALTLIFTALYYLTSMQKMIFESDDPHIGKLPDTMHDEEPRDVTWHENAGMFVLGALTILFGILPFIFWDMMSAWSTEFIQTYLVHAMNMLEASP
ncbi:MAG: NADH-quinone oxidoreductase subunit M [Candidatus Thermoplasmatota archaeon]|nr:NADH-quinone oxidoreductase subunit M [Candidatus Thermoplasmatota archaeon]MEC7197930.1 NADH-quinone oxidoreductase subunit M [Candidatus Thermoplasmatota archaeon]MEC7431077.1 NADH-quinone oxidoreductase subunit M [Candidatus Thermoplasmatota archaeon]